MSDLIPDIHRTLGRVEAKLEAQGTTLKRVSEKQDHLSDRISFLENYRSWLLGAWAIVVGIATFFASRLKG